LGDPFGTPCGASAFSEALILDLTLAPKRNDTFILARTGGKPSIVFSIVLTVFSGLEKELLVLATPVSM